MSYRLYDRIAIQKRQEDSVRKILLIARIIRLKRALALIKEISGNDSNGIRKGSGEKVFRPKALVVASLAECALSSHFPLLLKAYLIKVDL